MSGLDYFHEAVPWHADAACLDHPDVNWFTELGESTSEAKTICFTCPVRRPCRDAGMYERHGIWGGLSERERRRRRELGITLIDDITDPTDHQENQAS
jgi:WhiB family redox-sensing transcriptional regulator